VFALIGLYGLLCHPSVGKKTLKLGLNLSIFERRTVTHVDRDAALAVKCEIMLSHEHALAFLCSQNS
jgi:hypothetical protein